MPPQDSDTDDPFDAEGDDEFDADELDDLDDKKFDRFDDDELAGRLPNDEAYGADDDFRGFVEQSVSLTGHSP